jgi:RNA polymerase sigma-70 factor (ECF subfamily)
MRLVMTSLACLLATAPIGRSTQAEDVPTVATAPPVVVKTVPQAGATDVDPELKTIKVTFSKDMDEGGYSWVQVSKESFPKVDGEVKYEKDKRTCVLPVKLEPGKTYVLWINTSKFENLKDSAGRSAVPYLLVFETTPKK